MNKERLLIIDDEEDMLQMLKRMLEPELGCEVVVAARAADGLQIVDSQPLDLVLVDMKMPEINGMEVLERIRQNHPWLTVIMLTAHSCIELAIEAIKTGAYDFIGKPFDHDALVLSINKALERSRLLRENLKLQHHVRRQDAFQNLVGRSAKMQRVYETIQMVAKTDLTVLITGESGTGKDLVARAIHALSDRSGQSFVAVNCPTVPENILESELFGYRKGAFTHASQNKIGLFQEAHRGSIFLDEIGDISTTIQTKLLRVLQEKEIKPLGDTKSMHIDVRVIASTNRNLPEKIRHGEFREDLFYRLNVLPIELPPLRERREDIPLLVNHFLEKHCTDLKRPQKSVSPELMELFLLLPWEGNVRELESIIMRGILYAAEDQIHPADVGIRKLESHSQCLMEDTFQNLAYREAKEVVLQRFHAHYIGSVLSATQGNVSRAARLCGLERQGLQQLMRRYAISAEAYRSSN